MGQSRRSFTPEFKQDAVDLCRRSGKSECQVARELGIPQPTFNRWMRQVAGAPLGSNRFLATEELKVLRREVEQLRVERDILKKAVAFFAKESGGGIASSRQRRPRIPWRSCVACSPWPGAAITPGAVVRSVRARSRIKGCSHRFEPVTRRREAATGVRGFITSCAPTGFGSAAIAWPG